MSAERSGKSHGIAWTVIIIAAVPILYLLSVQPLIQLTVRATPSWPYGAHRWLELYCTPMNAVHDVPWLGEVLWDDYAAWWERRLPTY